MTDRKFFITTCPQCRGTRVGNADHKSILQYVRGGYGAYQYDTTIHVPTIDGADRIPCPTCDARGKVIAQVMAPLVAEEMYL